MTCCFQGWYHGNTEEDGRLYSASLRRECGGEQRPSRCGGKVGGSRYPFTLDYSQMLKGGGVFRGNPGLPLVWLQFTKCRKVNTELLHFICGR